MFIGLKRAIIGASKVTGVVTVLIQQILSGSFASNVVGRVESVDTEGNQIYPVQEGRAYLFDGTDDYIAAAHLSGSETVISSDGTSTPSISAGRIDFTAGTCWNLLLSDGSLYKMDEQSGITSYDSSGNENHGVITNATLSTFHTTQNGYSFQNQVGYSGALSFDGVNDYIQTTGDDTLRESTYCFWVKNTKTTSAQIFGHSDNIGNFNLNYASNRPIIYLSGSNFRYWDDNPAQDDGNWHHYCLYIAGAAQSDINNARLYIDNILQPTNLTIDSDAPIAWSALRISNASFAPDGSISDFRIFDKDLTAQERADVFAGLDVLSGLEGQWKLNEMSGTQALDSSGNNNHGTIDGASWHAIPRDEGIIGRGLIFNEVNDAVNCGSDSSMDNIFSGGGEVEFYINPTSGSGLNRILQKSAWHARMNNQRLRFTKLFSSTSGSWLTPNPSITYGDWIKVNISYNSDSDANVPIIEIDDVVQILTVDISPSGTSISDVGDDLFIGNDSGLDDAFDGLVAQVKMWDDITQTNIVGQWMLKDMTGTVATDSSGNGNDGTITGPAWFVNDITGNALDYVGRVKYNAKLVESNAGTFDGSNDVVLTGEQILNNTSNVSFSAWIKPSSAATAVIFGESQSSSLKWGIYQATTSIGMTVDGAATSVLATPNTLTDLHHVVGTYDGTTIKIYLNSVLQDAVTSTQTPLSSAEIALGARDDASLPFPGQIFDARLFDIALNQSQINQIYNKYLDIGVDPVAWWPLAEGAGSTVYDVSGNDNHGTITNATLATFWGTSQDEVHYNIQKGFEYYDDDATHTDVIRVPYEEDGSLITPTIASYSKISANQASYYHNDAETLLEQYPAPELINNDANDFYFTAGTPNQISYADIVADVNSEGKILADVFTANQKKNLRIIE